LLTPWTGQVRRDRVQETIDLFVGDISVKILKRIVYLKYEVPANTYRVTRGGMGLNEDQILAAGDTVCYLGLGGKKSEKKKLQASIRKAVGMNDREMLRLAQNTIGPSPASAIMQLAENALQQRAEQKQMRKQTKKNKKMASSNSPVKMPRSILDVKPDVVVDKTSTWMDVTKGTDGFELVASTIVDPTSLTLFNALSYDALAYGRYRIKELELIYQSSSGTNTTSGGMGFVRFGWTPGTTDDDIASAGIFDGLSCMCKTVPYKSAKLKIPVDEDIRYTGAQSDTSTMAPNNLRYGKFFVAVESGSNIADGTVFGQLSVRAKMEFFEFRRPTSGSGYSNIHQSRTGMAVQNTVSNSAMTNIPTDLTWPGTVESSVIDGGFYGSQVIFASTPNFPQNITVQQDDLSRFNVGDIIMVTITLTLGTGNNWYNFSSWTGGDSVVGTIGFGNSTGVTDYAGYASGAVFGSVSDGAWKAALEDGTLGNSCTMGCYGIVTDVTGDMTFFAKVPFAAAVVNQTPTCEFSMIVVDNNVGDAAILRAAKPKQQRSNEKRKQQLLRDSYKPPEDKVSVQLTTEEIKLLEKLKLEEYDRCML